MKIWLMKLRLGFGIWLREYLGISRLERDAQNVKAVLAMMRDAEAQHHRDSDRGLGALRNAEERHYCDLLNGQQEMEQKLDIIEIQQIGRDTSLAKTNGAIEEAVKHLINLVEPKAGRLRAGAPPTLDWDEVQRQNLQQLEENKDGQPVRR